MIWKQKAIQHIHRGTSTRLLFFPFYTMSRFDHGEGGSDNVMGERGGGREPARRAFAMGRESVPSEFNSACVELHVRYPWRFVNGKHGPLI